MLQCTVWKSHSCLSIPRVRLGLYYQSSKVKFYKSKVFQRCPIPATRPLSVIGSSATTRSIMGNIERLADDLEKPELDDRSYRVIKLQNELEALLVHDPKTDKASASVNVNVGSFSDADDMPGMAHAVEHLLFMGTEKVS
jgi:insulysin